MEGIKIFHTASDKEILDGKLTDVYFNRSRKILKQEGIDKKVRMEARVKNIKGGDWGIFTGLQNVQNLLKGKDIDLWALPEGSAFRAYEPVLVLETDYKEFAPLETPLLGFICQATGISTKAARIKAAAESQPVYHFGARRMHPSIAPMIGRSAYIGGCDGVAVTKTAEMLGLEPVGTIPHALILILEDSTTATGMFNKVFGDRVKSVALVDTFGDEKFEALENADSIEGLQAVRLDTPSSRRGDMLEIAREVRWELDLNGFDDVQIFISGGLDEGDIRRLNPIADAYGVGTSISNAPVQDFALDIVEIEGESIAKRGKRSGAKKIFKCEECGDRFVRPWKVNSLTCPDCETKCTALLEKVIEDGKITDQPEAEKVREFSLKNRSELSEDRE